MLNGLSNTQLGWEPQFKWKFNWELKCCYWIINVQRDPNDDDYYYNENNNNNTNNNNNGNSVGSEKKNGNNNIANKKKKKKRIEIVEKITKHLMVAMKRE